MAHAPTIDRLLNQVPDSPSIVLEQLRAHPDVASRQDAHGYSLVHAATSYNHIPLLHALIRDFHVDPNITDEDGETALFNAETVEIAQELLRLGVKLDMKNDEGQTAAEKLDDEDEQPLIAGYLREAATDSTAEGAASVLSQTAGANTSAAALAGTANGDTDVPHAPPPMPNGVKINVGTMQQEEAGEAPDPEFRRRIEELAAREDFEGEEGQRELRSLVQDAVLGLNHDSDAPASSRRRLG
ncbi:hypothetical protein LTR36_001024 [Oleoguttula mirabilis]|uniref:Ankyrin repeat protein n=1 Tax=Oleoguttula mirabilis TaxID=1507867 RepID=A0AAV9JPQ9_9PEZI|nr:hypothetical protein LTR36_001024 [Oleoguttula mirabilis]